MQMVKFLKIMLKQQALVVELAVLFRQKPFISFRKGLD